MRTALRRSTVTASQPTQEPTPVSRALGVHETGDEPLIDWSTRQRVSILGNSIHSNGSLGIMLGFGPNPRANDANDVDTGPNNGQNYPALTSAVPGSGTAIAGSLNSTPSTM